MLYRRYRPQTFTEVQGQDHVVQTLRGALTSGHIAHAYLFCGPRGTGKTTLARLLAKTLMCQQSKVQNSNAKFQMEPCNACVSCAEINEGRSLDLIEIDAASHTGVENIRDLTDSARVAASTGGYKIFLVDEVHMLSKSAFNALLKTLEEPPPHIIFLLATTEPHKLPDTILSRVQRFDLKKLSKEEIQKKLERIAKTEKLSVAPEAITAIADYANGAMRDAESALSKLTAFAGTTVSARDAITLLGIIPETFHAKLLAAISDKRAADAIACIAELNTEGVDLEHFTKQFIEYVRKQLVGTVQNRGAAAGVPPAAASANPRFLAGVARVFMHARSQLKTTPVPTLPLELAVAELADTAIT